MGSLYQSFSFTPTEVLILEVLTARRRLGHSTWTFSTANAQALRKLEDKGLVSVKDGPEQHTLLVWFTEKGIATMLGRRYNVPAAKNIKRHQKDLRKLAKRFKKR